MNGVVIRPSTAADAQAMAGFIRDAFAEQAALDPPSGAVRETTKSIAIKIGSCAGLVAELEDSIVGCALISAQGGALEMHRLAVARSHRGLGIGKMLIEAAEARAAFYGLTAVSVGARLALPKNIALYQRLGYEITEYCTHAGYSEPTYVKMVKRLVI